MTEIYGLHDPDTDELRYIGKAVDAQKRLKGHLREYRRRKTPLYCWIKKLVDENRVPVLSVLEVCSDGTDWRLREIALIAEHKPTGRLLNVALGGDEPCCPPEVRAANGRKVAVSRVSDPDKAETYRIKRTLGNLLKLGYVREDTKVLMRQAAAICPELFGAWTNLK